MVMLLYQRVMGKSMVSGFDFPLNQSIEKSRGIRFATMFQAYANDVS
jgi:hypothetical protein